MRVKSVMIVVVSLVVLFGALYVLLSKNYDTNMQNWASGVVGAVMTYWLTPYMENHKNDDR